MLLSSASMTEGVVAASKRSAEVVPEASVVGKGAPPTRAPELWFRSVRGDTEKAFAFYREVRERGTLAYRVREETERTRAWLGRNPTLQALQAFHEERGPFFDWLADTWEGEMRQLVAREADEVCRAVVADLRENPPSDKMPTRAEDARELRRVLTILNTDDFAERFSQESAAPFERFTEPDAEGRRWFQTLGNAELHLDERRALHIAYLLSPPDREPGRDELLALALWVSPMLALVDSFDRLLDEELTQRVTHAMRVAMVGKQFE